ncbi:MAG: S1 family peptidase [Terrimicrobiaceae bacterium]
MGGPLSVLGFFVILLAGLAASPGQAAEEGTPTAFGDGLAMTIPAGWEITEIDKESTARGQGMPPDETMPVTLLLHARSPGDGTASLTIARDESFGAHGSGPMAGQALFSRLSEIAAGQGYRADRPSTKGTTMTKDPVILAEIVGISAQGERRIFACLSVSRFPGFSLRCYWQWDERDEGMRVTFENWLAVSTFTDQKISDLLAGKAAGSIASGTPGAAPTKSPPPDVAMAPPAAPVAAANGRTAAEPMSKEAGIFARESQDRLVVVKGEKGTGSGFVCRFDDGKTYLLTNAHVLSSNPQPTFATMGGASLEPGEAALGVDSDIFRGILVEGVPAFDMLTEADGAVNIGDAVAVLGNAEGAGVIKVLEGKIVGLGPNLVEVDAPFVPGNSGSPIIHVPTGKVIGIATYLLIRKVDSGLPGVEAAPVVRRFGYRLDKVKTWESLDWTRFYAQSAQADRIEATSGEFQQLFEDAREKKMSSVNFSNPEIRRAVETLERSGRSGARMSDADLSKLKRDFLGKLRIAAQTDVNAFDSRNAYDYFRRLVADEKKFRDEIAEGFTKVINSTR